MDEFDIGPDDVQNEDNSHSYNDYIDNLYSELIADSYLAQFDDDPSPYHGDYFEDDGE